MNKVIREMVFKIFFSALCDINRSFYHLNLCKVCSKDHIFLSVQNFSFLKCVNDNGAM